MVEKLNRTAGNHHGAVKRLRGMVGSLNRAFGEFYGTVGRLNCGVERFYGTVEKFYGDVECSDCSVKSSHCFVKIIFAYPFFVSREITLLYLKPCPNCSVPNVPMPFRRKLKT